MSNIDLDLDCEQRQSATLAARSEGNDREGCQCAGRSRAQLYQLISKFAVKQTTLGLRSNAGFCDSDNVILNI